MFGWLKKRQESSAAVRSTVRRARRLFSGTRSESMFYCGADTSALLYRYGYLVSITNAFSDEPLWDNPQIHSWPTHEWSGLTIKVHPETPLHFSSKGGMNVCVIGHVFDPFNKTFDAQALASDLCDRSANEDAFHHQLDNLSGKFVVLLGRGNTWRVYQDAFASKSVYYDAQVPGVVGSHAELVADATGDGVDLNVIAFLQSPAYQKRDVKYLPGLRTIYQNVFYCPGNHVLELVTGAVRRYYPRPYKDEPSDDLLIRYLDGYSDYIVQNFDRELFGLTGGLDSRTMLAPLSAKKVPMTTFTLNRGDVNGGSPKDIALAKQLSAEVGADHHEVVIDYAALTPNYFKETMQVLRQNTGFARLNSPVANTQLYARFKKLQAKEKLSYSRGFGGEILRGFYQGKGGEISSVEARQFASAYGVMPKSPFVRDSFQDFINRSDFSNLDGVDINDVFYWEHRMSGWGSLAVAETDILACTFVGYNSRRLYNAFFSRPFEERDKRVAFKRAIEHFNPKLLNYDVE